MMTLLSRSSYTELSLNSCQDTPRSRTSIPSSRVFFSYRGMELWAILAMSGRVAAIGLGCRAEPTCKTHARRIVQERRKAPWMPGFQSPDDRSCFWSTAWRIVTRLAETSLHGAHPLHRSRGRKEHAEEKDVCRTIDSLLYNQPGCVPYYFLITGEFVHSCTIP